METRKIEWYSGQGFLYATGSFPDQLRLPTQLYANVGVFTNIGIAEQQSYIVKLKI